MGTGPQNRLGSPWRPVLTREHRKVESLRRPPPGSPHAHVCGPGRRGPRHRSAPGHPAGGGRRGPGGGVVAPTGVGGGRGRRRQSLGRAAPARHGRAVVVGRATGGMCPHQGGSSARSGGSTASHPRPPLPAQLHRRRGGLESAHAPQPRGGRPRHGCHAGVRDRLFRAARAGRPGRAPRPTPPTPWWSWPARPERANADPGPGPSHRAGRPGRPGAGSGGGREVCEVGGGWALVEGGGTRPFVPPDDPRHPRRAHAPPSAA